MGRTLNQKQIVAAALEILKEKGLSELSLRGIGQRLNVQAPAIYWHFKNKEMLVDYMAEAILEKEFKEVKPRERKERWQKWLMQTMLRLRKAMLNYPDGARVVAGAHLYPVVTLLQIFELALVALTSDGVSGQKAFQIMIAVIPYTFGAVIEEQSGLTPEEQMLVDPKTFFAPYPNFAKVVGERWNKGDTREEDFVRGLEYIIKGAE